MTTTRQAILTLAFMDATDRKFKFNGIDAENVDAIKSKVTAINIGLASGQMPYFAQTFVSDTGAECIMISGAQVITTEEEVIYNAS